MGVALFCAVPNGARAAGDEWSGGRGTYGPLPARGVTRGRDQAPGGWTHGGVDAFTSPYPSVVSKEEGGVWLRQNHLFLYYCRAASLCRREGDSRRSSQLRSSIVGALAL